MSHDKYHKISTMPIILSYTEENYDLIGIVVYKEFRYPAKFTYSLTKYVKIVIQDDDQCNLIHLFRDYEEIYDHDIVFYSQIYNNPIKIKFHGLKLYRNMSHSMIACSTYCVIYENNSQEIDWNKTCNAQISFADIDHSFWHGLTNHDIEKNDLTLYDECKISIKPTFSFTDIDIDFYDNLITEKQEKTTLS